MKGGAHGDLTYAWGRLIGIRSDKENFLIDESSFFTMMEQVPSDKNRP